MTGPISRLNLGVALALFTLSLAGCGQGVDNSEFTANPGQTPPDAPRTAAEYDAKYPVPNAGDSKPKMSQGKVVTEP